jgi:hypothetical protein
MTTMQFSNRITEMLGVEVPLVQAPMGWIARSQLASAVSEAGGLGIIETSSGELDAVRQEIIRMRELTDKPFGVNIAQAFVRDPDIVRFVIDQGVRFVTTSAGNPERYTAQLKDAGLTVFHVVPSLSAALKAVECGVDGLVVEGGEGGGFKNPREVSTMVLLPLVRSRVDVPIIAAGGVSWTVLRWRPPSPWAPKRCRWVPGWFRRRNPPCTTIGRTPSSLPGKRIPCFSTGRTHRPCARCERRKPAGWNWIPRPTP